MTVPTTREAVDRIRAALSPYVYRVRDEAELQEFVSQVFAKVGIRHQREVFSGAGRYDILCDYGIVVELKVKGRTVEVERQAMRYAQMGEVDAVMVVTTSQRLYAGLTAPGDLGQERLWVLGGKLFDVLALRTL